MYFWQQPIMILWQAEVGLFPRLHSSIPHRITDAAISVQSGLYNITSIYHSVHLKLNTTISLVHEVKEPYLIGKSYRTSGSSLSINIFFGL